MLLESLLTVAVSWSCFFPYVNPVNPGKSAVFLLSENCFVAKN